MNIHNISAEYSASPQIQLNEIPVLAKLGYRSILCNRPDNKDENQPTFESIKAAAASVNIEAFHLPVIPGNIDADDIHSFEQITRTMTKPTLAYCRTGGRAEALWTISQANRLPEHRVPASNESSFVGDQSAPKAKMVIGKMCR